MELLKLNLGCNTRIRPGYINIDKDKYPGVDMVSDVSKIALDNGSTCEIYASNILEHFSHTRTLDILREWYRLLGTDGILKLSVPDFDRAIEIYHKDGLGDWVVNFLWGDQGYKGANHYCGFNEERLAGLLKQAGFSDISRVEQLPGNQHDECSNLVSTIDKKFICLNMVAVKE